ATRVCRIGDCIACFALSPLGADLGGVDVLRCLRLVDSSSNALTMRFPVALDLLPMSFALVVYCLRLRVPLSGELVGVLTRLVDLGFQLDLALRSSGCDGPLGLVDLRCERVKTPGGE